MSMKPNRRPGLRLMKLVALTWLSPLLGVCWATLRGGGQVWHKLFALSLCGNLLFVIVLALGFYYETVDTEVREDVVLPFGFSRLENSPLGFCESLPDSELTRVLPNTIYVASVGIVRARFEFTDESRTTLVEITLTDKYGRPWIDANLEDGTFIYSRYSAAEQENPNASLMDKDGDGVHDTMVDWIRGKSYERRDDCVWYPYSRKD